MIIEVTIVTPVSKQETTRADRKSQEARTPSSPIIPRSFGKLSSLFISSRPPIQLQFSRIFDIIQNPHSTSISKGAPLQHQHVQQSKPAPHRTVQRHRRARTRAAKPSASDTHPSRTDRIRWRKRARPHEKQSSTTSSKASTRPETVADLQTDTARDGTAAAPAQQVRFSGRCGAEAHSRRLRGRGRSGRVGSVGFRTGGEGFRSWGAAEGEGLSGVEVVKHAACGGKEVCFFRLLGASFYLDMRRYECVQR